MASHPTPPNEELEHVFTTVGKCRWHGYDPIDDFDYDMDDYGNNGQYLIQSGPPQKPPVDVKTGMDVFILDEEGNSRRFGFDSATNLEMRPQCHNIFKIQLHIKSQDSFLCAMPRRPEERLWAKAEEMIPVIVKPGHRLLVSINDNVYETGTLVQVECVWAHSWKMMYQIFDPGLNRVTILSQEIPHDPPVARWGPTETEGTEAGSAEERSVEATRAEAETETADAEMADDETANAVAMVYSGNQTRRG